MNKKIKDNIIIILFLMTNFLFALPSIIYVVKNKTIYNFYLVWTYFFKVPTTNINKYLNAIAFFIIISTIFILYFNVLKKQKKLFKSVKKVFIVIFITSLLFLLIIPYTSTDVYSYIANGWSAAHYHENPYYKSTGQIVDEKKINEPMFNKVARCWRYETVVYGPVWTLICTVFSYLSFGNIDVALLIFKIANLAVHMFNCWLIYKITNKKQFVLLYGLNPFILFEGIANVHNDIFIILFILLAIYFLVKKKKLFLAVAFIAIATAIKYLAILIIPFLILYYVRNKDLKERINCCIYCAIEYISIIALFYIIYLKDLNVLAGLFIQQSKYNRSIFYLLYEILNKNEMLIQNIQHIALAIFAICYAYIVIKLLFNKNIKLRNAIQKYHLILIVFTFILITNFNPWYIMWLYPTMFYLKGKSIKNIIHLSYTAEIANIASFILWSEEQILGIPYFIIMIIGAIILNLVYNKTNWKTDQIAKKKLKGA